MVVYICVSFMMVADDMGTVAVVYSDTYSSYLSKYYYRYTIANFITTVIWWSCPVKVYDIVPVDSSLLNDHEQQ